MENLNQNEKASSKLCKKWMVIERCAWCVFETLCTYEDNIKKNNAKNNKS